MNKIFIIGNLTRDPELTMTKTKGMAVCTMTVAVNRHNAAAGQASADFFRVKAFGARAESASRYLKKGSKVGIVGEVSTYNYKDKDGVQKSGFDVLASEVEFLSRKGETTESAGTDNQTAQADYSNYGYTVSDDDLPF